MSTMTRWQEAQPYFMDRLEAAINNDPNVLLEHDGGPEGMTADVILARLYGFDEQIDHDWRIRRVEHELRAPIAVRPTVAQMVDDLLMPRYATYKLQSSYAQMKVAGEYAPADVRPGPPDFLVSVLFLRYKRRS